MKKPKKTHKKTFLVVFLGGFFWGFLGGFFWVCYLLPTLILAKALVTRYSHIVCVLSVNVENLDLCGGGVEADERLQDVKDLRLAAVEHVLAQVHVQRLRVSRQGVVPAQESDPMGWDFTYFHKSGMEVTKNKNHRFDYRFSIDF